MALVVRLSILFCFVWLTESRTLFYTAGRISRTALDSYEKTEGEKTRVEKKVFFVPVLYS
jgi:hypothetical protein